MSALTKLGDYGITKLKEIARELGIRGYTKFNSGNKNELVKLISKKWSEESSNQLIELLEMYPDLKWSWINISLNPNLTREYLLSHLDKPWNWDAISRNPNFDPEFILSHMDLPWNWTGLSLNPNMTPEFLLSHLTAPDGSKFPWNWDALSKNPGISPDFMFDHPEFDWNWNEVTYNPNLTLDFVIENPDLYWDWDYLTDEGNKDFFDEKFEGYVLEHLDKFDNGSIKHRLNGRSLVSMDFVMQNLDFFDIDEDSMWEFLSGRNDISEDFVRENIERDLDWEFLSSVLNPEFIFAHYDKPWDWSEVTTNPHVTPEFVLSHLYFPDGTRVPWDWELFPRNVNLTPNFIKRYPRLSLKLSAGNPNITAEYVRDHLEEFDKPLNWVFVVMNRFEKDPRFRHHG